MRWLICWLWLVTSCSAKQDLLTSADPQERREAVKALGRSSDRSAAIKKLAPILRSDPDEWVRWDAAYALGRLGSPETTPLLVEKAQSLDTAQVRGAAMTAIEWTRDPAAIPGMIGVWRLERNMIDAGAHTAASLALKKIGRPAIEPLLALALDRSRGCRGARSR